jgi:two-component system, NarL family, response regulator NreC
MPHRILIVDDQPIVRQALRALLSSANEWRVCGEAVDGLEAVEKANALQPDLIIMDISMPRLNGIEAAQIIRREVPDAKVLIVSQNAPEILASEAAVADAHGFMSKNDVAAHLLTLMKRIIAA